MYLLAKQWKNSFVLSFATNDQNVIFKKIYSASMFKSWYIDNYDMLKRFFFKHYLPVLIDLS